MHIELLIGLPASGKTKTCIDRIKSLQSPQSIKSIWVIVPDRYQAASFRQRMAQSGGALGVQVGRFEDLSRSLLEHDGKFQPIASLPLQNRVIRESIKSAVDQGSMTHFLSISDFPGFVTVLRDAFTELKRELVSVEHFLEIAEQGTIAQKELGILYKFYQKRLSELNCADPQDIHQNAISFLEENEKAVSDIEMIIVDGFDQFTAVQYCLMKLLSQKVGDLLITMTGSAKDDRIAHRRFSESTDQLKKELSPEIIYLDDEPRLPDIPLHLERHIFENGTSTPFTCQSPILFEVRSPAEEAREALRWIKGLVVRENIFLTDCAIFTPNPSVYNPLLRTVAEEFGIPIRFSVDEPLENSAAIASLMNLLSLPSENFKSQSLVNVLRSPYFDFSLEPEEIHALERISQLAQIIEGRDQWDETWERLQMPPGKQQTWLDDERNAPELPREAEAVRYKKALDKIFDLITPPEVSLSLSSWIIWLEDFLEELHFFENADVKRDQSALDAFMEILSAILMSESIAGEDQVDYQQFISELFSLLRSEGYRESRIVGQPDLLVGRMTEARGIRFEAVALFGLAEGAFPVVEREDPFLGEDFRQALGLESRLNREQVGIFYQAITRADKHLLITRPYLAEDGEDWEASAYWKAVSNLISGNFKKTINPESSILLWESGSKQELLFNAVRGKEFPQEYPFIKNNWNDVLNAQEVLKARRSKRAESPYEGNLKPVLPLLTKLYSSAHVWSASQLESYAICPFNFYISRTLALESRETPELGINARQLGSMLHEIMELTYKNTSDPSDLPTLLTSLHQQVEEVFSFAPQNYGFRPSSMWKFEQTHLFEKLEETIKALEEDKTWIPSSFEEKFGLSEKPKLEIDLDEYTLVVRGVIDRIDKNERGELRIIDYKTGSSHLSTSDLTEGNRLQLPIYALAARDALNLGEPVEGFYWWLQGGKRGSLRLSSFSWEEYQGFDAAVEVTLMHLGKIINGILTAKFTPDPPPDGCPSYCPAAQWCWQYQAGW